MSRIALVLAFVVPSILGAADAAAGGPGSGPSPAKRAAYAAQRARGADGRFLKASPRDRAMRGSWLGRAVYNPLVGWAKPATIAVHAATATRAGTLEVSIPDMKIAGLYATTRIRLGAIDVHGKLITIDATIHVPSAGHGTARGVGPATIVGTIPPGAMLSQGAIERAVGLATLQPGRRLAPVWAPAASDPAPAPAPRRR